MKRVLGAILFVLYSIVAITVTILLLSYNDYNISEIGDYTVYIAKDDLLEPRFEKGSILIIEKTTAKNVQSGDEIFLYKVINSQEFEVITAKLQNKIQQGSRTAYVVDNGETYSSDYFIGKVEDTSVIGSPWGTVLSILESKWGFLFCIVIVSLLLFLQEVFDLIIELKYGGTKGTKAAHTANARKNAKKSTTKKAGTKTTTTATKTTATKTTTAKTSTVTKATAAAKTVAKVAETNNTQTGVEEEG